MVIFFLFCQKDGMLPGVSFEFNCSFFMLTSSGEFLDHKQKSYPNLI